MKNTIKAALFVVAFYATGAILMRLGGFCAVGANPATDPVKFVDLGLKRHH